MELLTIYRVVNNINGKCYIGVTKNFRARAMYHFSALKSGLHHNRALRAAYEEFGAGAFSIEILEENVHPDDRDAGEMWWITFFNSHFEGYNGTPGNRYSRWGRQKKTS